MILDTEKLTIDIKSAATIILSRDVSAIEGFDIKYVAKIVRQAENTAVNIRGGMITKETRDFLTDGIRSSANAFAESLKGVDVYSSGKLVYAIVFVVFKTITNATGVELKA